MSQRIFAIGDIHGCFDPLKRLVEETIHLKKEDKLVLLGDYIDRGKQSREVINYILNLQDLGFDVVPLKGNHESMLLEAYEDENNLPLWMFNGGLSTLRSFGIPEPRNLEQTYVSFFRSLKYFYSCGKYLFVHAGFNDDIADPFSDHYAMIWKCRDQYVHPQLREKTIVHGHCITKVGNCRRRIETHAKVIGIDTGCVYTGREGFGNLSAIEVNSLELFVVSNDQAES